MGEVRLYLGDEKTDPRWRDRLVTVLVRAKGKALVEFDDGTRLAVPTYRGGVGALLRIPPQPQRGSGDLGNARGPELRGGRRRHQA